MTVVLLFYKQVLRKGKKAFYAYRTLLLCTGGGIGTFPFGACGFGVHGPDDP